MTDIFCYFIVCWNYTKINEITVLFCCIFAKCSQAVVDNLYKQYKFESGISVLAESQYILKYCTTAIHTSSNEYLKLQHAGNMFFVTLLFCYTGHVPTITSSGLPTSSLHLLCISLTWWGPTAPTPVHHFTPTVPTLEICWLTAALQRSAHSCFHGYHLLWELYVRERERESQAAGCVVGPIWMIGLEMQAETGFPVFL